jgi:hypothetical protein
MTKAEAGRLGWLKSKEINIAKARAKSVATRAAHEALDPKCRGCKSSIPYEKRTAIYCSQKCWGKHKTSKARKTGLLCKGCKLRPPRWNRRHLRYCDECIAKGINRHLATLTASTDAARRRYLLRTRKNECAICGLTRWQGKPAPLEMDHADGDSDHNTEDNLRLLCANCHAQQPTSKGKNIGRGREKRRLIYASAAVRKKLLMQVGEMAISRAS